MKFGTRSKPGIPGLSLLTKGDDAYANLIDSAQQAKSQSRWQDAADLYEKAHLLRESFGVMVQMGHMNKEAGNLDRAEASYFSALDIKPQDPDLNLQIGHFFFVKGDLEKSVDFYRKAVQLDPDNGIYSENLRIGERRLYEAPFKDKLESAMLASKLGLWKKAEADFRAVLKAGSKDYQHMLGHALREQGRLQEAIECYRSHFEHVQDRLSDEPMEAALMIGNTLRLAGEYSEASVWLMRTRAIRMAREGWVGSVDNLLGDVESSLRRVHPSLDCSYIR